MTATLQRIGFMQGRLSALVDGKIQAFPWNEWREEFPRAKALGLTRMEWTIDQDRLRENPLTTEAGPAARSARCARENAVRIPSLTGDCFMQAPFWKVDGHAREALRRRPRSAARRLQPDRHRIRRDPAGRQRQDRERASRPSVAARAARPREHACKAGRQDRLRIRSAAARARPVHGRISGRRLRHQLRQRQQRLARI